MNEKFDPAPHDKHADDPVEAAKVDRDAKTSLDQGLVETFPGSDPVTLRSRRSQCLTGMVRVQLMNDVNDKADIARANTGDPTPWIVILLCAATAGAVIGILLYVL